SDPLCRRPVSYDFPMPPPLSSSRFFLTTCPVVGGERVSPTIRHRQLACHSIRTATRICATTADRSSRSPSLRQSQSLPSPGLVAVPLWTALVGNWQIEVISDACGRKAQAAQQDCLEELGLGRSRQPAKGANAPIRLHPRQQERE